MEGKLCWDAQPMDPGGQVSEDGVLLPIPADASQLYAIRAASAGNSFVLHGPPGTGKSQTITALIANALAQGQTVLFVAEKMAALEVVQRRLGEIGLEPFCLELHSNRSRKRDVLEQLRQVIEVTRGLTCEQFLSKADQISARRKELDAYARGLHRKQPCGKTLYELLDWHEATSGAAKLPPFDQGEIPGISAERMEEMLLCARNLTAAAAAAGHPHEHPLAGIRSQNYTQTLRVQLPDRLDGYESSLEALAAAAAAFAQAAGRALPETRAQYKTLADIAEAILPWTQLPREWAQQENIQTYLAGVQELAAAVQESAGLREKLIPRWQDSFLDQDGRALQQEYQEIQGKRALARVMGLNSLVRRLVVCANGSVNKEQLPSDIDTLIRFQQARNRSNELFARYGAGLGVREAIDWVLVLQQVQTALQAAEAMDRLFRTPSFRMEQGGRRELEEPARLLTEAWGQMQQALSLLEEAIGKPETDPGPLWLTQQRELCRHVRDHMDELRPWMTWNRAAAEAEALGMSNLTLAIREGLPLDMVQPALERALASALCMAAIEGDPVLNTFSGTLTDEKIRQFRVLDKQLIRLTQREIFCRLAARVPDCTREAAQKAIRSGGRGISIRRLFEQLPNLLPRLCPCMLMSPISGAQYLDPRREPFDLVVFDEASQLPTSKAVGAIGPGQGRGDRGRSPADAAHFLLHDGSDGGGQRDGGHGEHPGGLSGPQHAPDPPAVALPQPARESDRL